MADLDDQRAAVAEMFAEAEIPHAWVGNEVVVPSELEDAADEMLDALEQDVSRRNVQQHRGRRKLIALVAFGAAGYFLYRDTQGSAVLRDWLATDLSPAGVALIAIGLLALWFRK